MLRILLALTALLALSATAEARHHPHHFVHVESGVSDNGIPVWVRHPYREPTWHYYYPSNRAERPAGAFYHSAAVGDCATAARMGGPCGCVAMKIVGLSDRRLWLVANWLAMFPRTSPHVGAAAIWGRHHVEIVASVNHDGTVSTHGSVGFARVPISRLRFVEPHA